MEWLKNNAYIANWIAVPIPLIIALIDYYSSRNANAGAPRHFDARWTVIYTVTLISVSVLFNPSFDKTGRDAAWFVLMFCMGAIVVGGARK